MEILEHVATMCCVVGYLSSPVVIPHYFMSGVGKWLKGK